MKNFVPLLFVSFFLLINFSCHRNIKYNVVTPNDSVVMFFAEKEYNFGIINSGSIVSHQFIVLNKGNSDLVIFNVITTCGCTAASFETKPIKPGKTGTILLKFDSTGKYGKMIKIATVQSNANPSTQDLQIIGEIN